MAKPLLVRAGLTIICAFLCSELIWANEDSIYEKLRAETDFVPTASKPLERLVEVARRFKIPMAIEWVETAENTESISELRATKRTVVELVHEIISGSEYTVQIEDGLLRVYSPAVASHPFNFLNIQLNNFQVKDGDLFDAEDQLRWAIRFTVEPEKYSNGYNGGYGHGSPDVFEIPRFTISSSDLTVRQALNQIALAQGNALWVATTNRSDLNRSEPRWKRKSVDAGETPITSGWHFQPLSDFAELAKERIVIDLAIKDFGQTRVANIPVMLEHGLAEGSGGATGGGSSAGVSFTYHNTIKKVGKDLVTLTAHLTVSREGESEFKFEEPIEISRGRVTEVRPEARITIKASIERAPEP